MKEAINFVLYLKDIKYCPYCKEKIIQVYDKDCFTYDTLSFELLSIVKNESFNIYKYSLFNKLKQISQNIDKNMRL